MVTYTPSSPDHKYRLATTRLPSRTYELLETSDKCLRKNHNGAEGEKAL
jgi:hypothetical protein